MEAGERSDAVAAAPAKPISIALVLVTFSLWAGAVYFHALNGSFVSDDVYYVQLNEYVHHLNVANVLAILDPSGPLIRVVENYAPVHLLLHGIVWQLFGGQVIAHHLVNVLAHALASALLFVLLRRWTGREIPSLLGASFFLLHPANVEAVAWISQLKTTSAMVLMLAGLLWHPKRPALALASFALALLAKPMAAVGIFVAIALGLAVQRGAAAGVPPGGARDWRWRWLAGWGVALLAFGLAEIRAFSETAGTYVVQIPDLATRVRTIFAVALRYLAMAVSGYGLSPFQDLKPATSWLDPWWLASLPVLGVLGWRLAVTLRRRSVEAAFWIWAALSFAPISGVVPLPHIIADRYLYFILPGLIGGVLLAGAEAVQRIPAVPGRPAFAHLGRVLAVLAVVWIAALARLAYARSFVWRSETTVMADTMIHYPEGRWALVARAAKAAARGERESAVEYLERARDMGFRKLDVLLTPRYANLRGTPGFDALLIEFADDWIERVKSIPHPNQEDLLVLAQGYIVKGDLDAAQGALEGAVSAGGARTDFARAALVQLEQMRRGAKPAP